jgi:3,4-dihydroxy-2-butanone 4-phosphate synthase
MTSPVLERHKTRHGITEAGVYLLQLVSVYGIFVTSGINSPVGGGRGEWDK